MIPSTYSFTLGSTLYDCRIGKPLMTLAKVQKKSSRISYIAFHQFTLENSGFTSSALCVKCKVTTTDTMLLEKKTLQSTTMTQ